MEKQATKLTEEDVAILNSKYGMKNLLRQKKINLKRALHYSRYEIELSQKQAEFIELQNWVIANNKKVIVLFQGRDAAGKGGAIRRIAAHINPRHYKIVALPKPTIEEKGQWYFQRYVNRLPKPGEIVFFDRSWYNRAVVEPVNGFCTPDQYDRFMDQVNDFERMIVDEDTYLIKFYFSITKEEQARRFADIMNKPHKRWKMSKVDQAAQSLWDVYTDYKQKMLLSTDTELCPWNVIDANRKTFARLSALNYILEAIPYRDGGSAVEESEVNED